MSQSSIQRTDYLLLSAKNTTVTVQDIRDFIADIKSRSTQYSYLIFDFSKATEIPDAAFRTLTFAGNLSTQPPVKIAIIGNSNMAASIKKCGLEKLISCHQSLENVFEHVPKATEPDKQFLSTALSEAVKVSLQNVASSDVTYHPFNQETGVDTRKLEIGAVVGLTGKSFRGLLTLGFTNEMYLKLMSKMLSTEYKEVTSDIEDGPAEILNMILGQFKCSLNEKDFGIVPAIPSTIRGLSLKISTPYTKDSTTILFFKSEFGDFYIEMTAHFQAARDAA